MSRFLQILGLIVAMVSAATVVYVNFIVPRMNSKTTIEAPIQQPVIRRSPFSSLKPTRTVGEDEINAAVDEIRLLYNLREVDVVGDPIAISLYTPEADQLALVYEVIGEENRISGVEVFDLSSTPPKSILHREGEDYFLHAVSVEEENKAKVYLLLEERTGATGLFLHLTFLEYDGFGKMREFYSLRDMNGAFLYPLQNRLILEENHSFYEMVHEETLVRLVDYAIEDRLGFHVLSYGVRDGIWHIKHNREVLLSEEKGLVLSLGEEILLVRDRDSEAVSARTLIDGPGLEYVEGPPVHIRVTGGVGGAILFLSDAEDMKEFRLPVEVSTRHK